MSGVMTGGDQASTADVFSRLRLGLRALEKLMAQRRRRDQAGTLLSDAWTDLQVIAQRLAATGSLFSDRPAAVGDEEEEDLAVAMADHVSLRDVVEAVETGNSEESLRQEIFEVLLQFQLRGARDPETVTKRFLAMVRRMRPGLIERHFGRSQADLARKLGEKRQSTQAREKAHYEKRLKEAGARGYKGAGGARSEAHRERCAKAQRGNRSRIKGQVNEGRRVEVPGGEI